MNTRFTARHFSASDRLQAYAIESVKKLEKFYEKILDVEIVLQPNEDHENPQQAELIVKVTGTVLKVSEAAPTYESALNAEIDTMGRQLIKYKNKRFKN